MAGGLISYGDALKAFRRKVYEFPGAWKCAVVGLSYAQTRYAFDEAVRILNASSLAVDNVSHTQNMIDVERGGRLVFRTIDDGDSLMGHYWPHIITLGGLDERQLSQLGRHLRDNVIDPKYFMMQEAFL